MDVRFRRAEPGLSYLICATPRSGSTLLCAALDDTGIAGHPEEHFEVLLETGQPRQPRDYFQRSNDPEVWALLDDVEFREVLGGYRGRYSEHPALRRPYEARPAEHRRRPEQGPAALAWVGRAYYPPGATLRHRVRPERGAQPRRRPRPRWNA